MKVFLVTYGNEKFKYSVKRIKKEANGISIIDDVFCFSEKDLPLFIKASPLFSSSKGGGYWLWKPYIVKKVLEQVEDGDVIIYSDAGNKLIESERWQNYINFLIQHDCVFFQYKENYNYGWSKFNIEYNDSPKLKFWIKKDAVNHFGKYFKNDEQWLEKSKIFAGFCLFKKTPTSLDLVNQWFETMLYFPAIVNDLHQNEIHLQISGFAQHRHDQSILSVLVRFYQSKGNVLVLDEEFETTIDQQAVRTLRIIDKKQVNRIRLSIYKFYRYFLKKIIIQK